MEQTNEQLSPVKRAILEIRELRARLDDHERRVREPIAIVGIGCRYPGDISDPESFWRVLRDGVDAITEVPRDRWDVDAFYDPLPDAPGKMSTRWGGFLPDVDKFDADFFGISSREAATQDPQQRLLLEVAWEALEHAGQAPEKLFGSPTGVFIGIGSFDYAQRQMQECDRSRIDAYLATGSSHSVASGRLSYVLGLQGPSLSIDTACSSSLVAVHLACQSLRAGECRMALAGGVNVILSPEVLVNFSRARMMAADGRCKTFDAAADGFVRSEGCAIVVLQRLSDALAQNARVLAVIRGSATNQDGRSSGLTAPNGPSQQAVIQAALANAGVSGADVHFIETHGTGTSLGDPIEVQALAATYGEKRPPHAPLRLGSVKTNIGHAESAAGIAGLIKVVLSLQHGAIPPHLHLRQLNPHIDWERYALSVPASGEPWPPGGQPRLAGVSSFGFSGTNAHVIVEEAPVVRREAPVADRPAHILAWSARTDQALGDTARRLADHLSAHPDIPFANATYTSTVGRSHMHRRGALVASSAQEACDKLHRFVQGSARGDVFTGDAEPVPPGVVFLFAGQGSQYPHMGRQLYESQPTFRRTMDRCDELLRPHIDQSVLSVIFGEGDTAALLDETAYTQPALFALEYSLAELWRSWGVEPATAIGHSLGEDIAACVAGVVSLADGLALVAARARLMQELPRDGAMIAVFADEARVRSAMTAYGDRISVAALNGPAHVSVSGERDAVDALAADLQRDGVRTKRLTTSHAFHSALMDPMLEPYERLANGVRYSPPRFGLVSTLTGDVVSGETIASGSYWRRHVRETVRFASGIRALYDRGYRVFVELGPNATLTAMGRHSVPEDDAIWVSSLKRGHDWAQLLESVARLHVRGVAIDWEAFDRDQGRERVTLPAYPFRRTRHWFAAAPAPAIEAPDARELFARAEARGLEQAAQVPLDLALHTYPAKWTAIDTLSLAYMLAALQALGAFRSAGERLSAEEVVVRCGVAPAHHKLVRRWLGLLADAALLKASSDGAYLATGADASALVREARAAASNVLADIPFFLTYVDRCGAMLADVITGRESPVETLFPGGSGEIAEQVYGHWAMSRYYNGIVRAVVEAFAAGLSRHRRIAVLEIGAGTGGTTATLAPTLAEDQTTYIFTDVSEYFLTFARRRFKEMPMLRYRLLDIERSPEAQGFEPASFDVVVAANVLHATRRLEDTLAHARSMVAPGGILVLYEVTDPPAWLDISFGLFEGWQRFDDEIRTGVPTVDRDTWIGLLKGSGFERVTALPAAGSPAEVLRAHVIVAQAPGNVVAVVAGARLEAAEHDDAGGATLTVDTRDTRNAELLEQLEDAAPAQRRHLLVEFVREHVSAVLCRDSSEPIDRRERLMDVGIDSLMAVELRDRLAADLPLTRQLPTTLVFDYPSIDAIAGLLDSHLPSLAGTPEGPATEEPVAVSARESEIRELSDADVEELLLKKLGTPS